MKKFILILPFIFLIALASADQRIYDNCNDGSLNTSLWNYTVVTNTQVGESTFLYYKIYRNTDTQIYGNVTSLAMPSPLYIKNMTFNVTIIANTSGIDELSQVVVYLFGEPINSLSSYSGSSGLRQNFSLYTIKKNSSISDFTFDLYINNRFQKTFNATNNILKAQLNLTHTIFDDSTMDNADFRINNVTYFYEEPSINYTAETYETQNEYYNYSVFSSTTPTSIYLNYSGTLYSGTATSLGSNIFRIAANIDVPASSGIKSFNFIWNNGTAQTSNNQSQLVNAINLAYCNSSISNIFVNYTFKNETASMQPVSASLSSATFNYFVGSGTSNKTYTYSNTTVANSRPFCFSPAHKTVYTSESLNYYNAESLQRTYTNSLATYTNSSTLKTLWLLPTSSGIYVSFQVVDGSIQPLQNALVTISRTGFGTIGMQLTDASGVVTFFLDPLATYTVSAAKSGYTTFSDSIVPTQTSYTINLGSGSLIVTPTDFTKGIDYGFTPTGTSLTNSTTYNFTFTLDSSYYDISNFGFNLTNSSGVSLGYNSSITEGTVSLQVSVGNADWVKVNAFWVIDSNYTNVTKTYRIIDSAGSEFSIWRFFTDLKSYLTNETDTDGLYGLKTDVTGTNFGLAIIIYMIIFSIVGVMSYKFGLNSPAAISAFIFTTCLFFEYTTGILDVLPNNNFPILSVITLIMTIALVVKEVSS